MAQPSNTSFGSPAINPFGKPTTSPVNNPFGKPNSTADTPAQPVVNVFSKPQPNQHKPGSFFSRPSSAGSDKILGAQSTQTSTFGGAAGSAPVSRVPSPANNPFAASPFQKPSATTTSVSSTSNPFGQPNQTSPKVRASNVISKIKAPFQKKKATFEAQQQPSGQVKDSRNGGKHGAPLRAAKEAPSGLNKGQNGPTREPSERTKELSPFAFNLASKINNLLRKEEIRPPQWLPDMGNPKNLGAVDKLKQDYKKYREKVYRALRKVELIDDPEVRRKLEDALPFKGTCEDMCPEYEKVRRIAEFDVTLAEKVKGADGKMWPEPTRMVKKFGRSAAGQEPPLPMDVRSVDALRRTTDYLLRDLLQDDSNLPRLHTFLWDRTRAVRRDFTFHSQKSRKELEDMVYIFESIARFHATSLHLLSRKGYGLPDFEQKQEINELGKTLLSLMEIYHMCKKARIECPNEIEFRAYHLLLNVHDYSIRRKVMDLGKRYLSNPVVQTLIQLIDAMDDLYEPRSVFKRGRKRPATFSNVALTNYIKIVESPAVSYTMGCIAAIHFNYIRQNILRFLVKKYARNRAEAAPRGVTAEYLNRLLVFDTPEEAVKFAEQHGFEMSTWHPPKKQPPPEPYLLLNDRRKIVPTEMVKHAYHGKLIERKRGTRSLPDLIFNTVFEETKPQVSEQNGDTSDDELFVKQTDSPSDKAKTTPSPIISSSTPSQSSSPAQENKPTPFGGSASNTPAFPPSNLQPPATSSNPFSNQNQQPASAVPSQPAPIFGKPADSLTQPASSTFGKPSQTTSTSTMPSQPASIFGKPADSSPTTSIRAPSFGKPTDSPQTNSTPMSQPASIFGEAAKSSTTAPSFEVPTGTTENARRSTGFLPTPTTGDNGGIAKPPQAPAAMTKDSTAANTALSVKAGPPVSFFPPTNQTSNPATPAFPTTKDSQVGQSVTPIIQVTPPSLPDISSSFEPLQSSSLTPAGSTQPTTSPGLGKLGLSSQAGWGSQKPATILPPAPKRDLMGDFTKWYVAGDGGLVTEFTEAMVENLLSNVFTTFQEEQAEKKRKEEDDKSWEEARKYQRYNLSVKYFYKWRENYRKLASKRILRGGKEKMKAYKVEQRALAKRKLDEDEKAAAAERRAMRRRLKEDGQRLSQMALSERKQLVDTEQELLASGIFSGLRDERAAARHVVRESPNGGPWRVSTFSPDYPESELELEPPRKSILAAQRTAQSPPESVDKKDGWKTKSLRQKFGFESRRSLSTSSSFNGSITKFRQSLPASAIRPTNFSRKRSASESSDEERTPKRKTLGKTNGFKSTHWDLRARGFVPLPNGDWVTEAVAESMRNSRRHSETEDHNPGSNTEHPVRDDESIGSHGNDDAILKMRERLARIKQSEAHRHLRHSMGGYELGSPQSSSSASPPPGMGMRNGSLSKRKRDDSDDGAEDGSSPSAKKTSIERVETEAMVENLQKMVRELHETMDEWDQDRPLLQEHMELAMLGNPSG